MSMMNNRKSLTAAFVTGALVFVIFSCIILQNTPKEEAPKAPQFQIVVAKNNILKDAAIKEEDVEIKDFPMNIEGGYKATGEVVGRTAKMDIMAEKPVLKTFLKEIVVKDEAQGGEEPKSGYRAVPALTKKFLLPPYVVNGAIVDLINQEHTLRIDNLKILNVLDSAKDGSNKIIVFEIKNQNVSEFVDILSNSKRIILIQKNKEEYGNYNFISTTGYAPSSVSANTPSKLPSVEDIPKIEELPEPAGDEYSSVRTQVELIIGGEKTKVEFE